MSRDMQPYSCGIQGSDGRLYVDGPGNGCGYHSGMLWPNMRLSTDKDVQAATLIANEAFKQGYYAAQQDIRNALGIK